MKPSTRSLQFTEAERKPYVIREITVDDETPPVAIEAYASDDAPRFVPLGEYLAEHPELRPRHVEQPARRRGRNRCVGQIRPRRGRRRESHRQRPGHRRVRSSRAAPDDDDDAHAPGWRWAQPAWGWSR